MGKKNTRTPANDGFSAPAQSKTVREKNAEKAAKRKSTLAAVSVILVIALCLGVMAYTKVADSGYFYRNTVSVKSENFEVNNAMMQYFFNVNYQQMYSSLSQLGVSTSSGLKDQSYPYSTEMTWFDYFMKNVTVPQVENILILCEAAKAEGIELDDHAKEHIDEAIESIESTIKSYSEQYGGAENYYLRNMYGYGINLDDIRSALELSQLASLYSEHMLEQYDFTEEEWNARLESDRSDYLKIDYYSYTFTAEEEEDEDEETTADTAADTAADTTAAVTEVSGSSSDAETTDTETAAEEEEPAERTAAQTAAYNVANLFAEQLKQDYNSAENEEGKIFFKEFVKGYLEEYVYNDETDEDEKTEKINTSIDGIENTSVSSDATNEFITFAFGEDRVDNVYLLENDSTGEYTVYYITKNPYIEEYNTKNIRLIALSAASEGTLSDRVTAVIEEFENGDKSETSFAALAETYSDDSTAHENGGLYENQGRGDAGIDELDAWLFSDERKAGDYSQFSNGESDTSEVTYIVYYVGDGLVKWQRDVDNDLTNEAYDADYEKLEEKYTIDVDYTELYKIPSQAGI